MAELSKSQFQKEAIVPSTNEDQSSDTSQISEHDALNLVFDNARDVLSNPFHLDDDLLAATLFRIYHFIGQRWRPRDIERWNTILSLLLDKANRQTKKRICSQAMLQFETVFPKSIGRALRVLDPFVKLLDAELDLQLTSEIFLRIHCLYINSERTAQALILKTLRAALKPHTFKRLEFNCLPKFKAKPRSKIRKVFFDVCEQYIESNELQQITRVRPLVEYLPPALSQKYFANLNRAYRSDHKDGNCFDSTKDASAEKEQSQRISIDLGQNQTFKFKKKQRISFE